MNSLKMKRGAQATQQRSRSALHVAASASSRVSSSMHRHGLASVNQLARAQRLAASHTVDVPGSRLSAKGIVEYLVERRSTPVRSSAAAAPGQTADSVVLSVLQNYSGLTLERLFNMLRNSGRFNESQSTLNSILSTLVSQGKVQNEGGLYRYVSKAGSNGSRASTPRASRSPSPAAFRTPARSSSASSLSGGDGASAGDEATVLATLANYSGLTESRLSGMLRNANKSLNASVSSVLNGLVSQGKVQNDNGTYRYVATAKTPTASRSASPVSRSSFTPSRSSAPASRASSASSEGGGNGANAGDEATVLAVLQNYSGLTEDRLSSMLRNARKSLNSSVSSVLNSLVSQRKVENDRGTFRYVATAKTPTASRSASPVSRPSTPARSSAAPARASFGSNNSVRPSSRPASRSATPGISSTAAVASDEDVVLSMLKNYSGLTTERLSNLLRNSGKWSGSASSLDSTLRTLINKRRVSKEGSLYKFDK